jgi:metallo-beta-lactamase class B
MAEIRKQTGARMLATEADKAVLEDGGRSDFFLVDRQYWFAPVKVDGVLKDGDVVKLGGIELHTHLTPGHTRGSVTYTMTIRENGRDYRVVFANIASVIGAKLSGNAKYPRIAEDFARSFRVQKALAVDVFLAAHGSQYGMREKYKGSYHPDAFVDPEGYRRAVAEAEKKYLDQLRGGG